MELHGEKYNQEQGNQGRNNRIKLKRKRKLLHDNWILIRRYVKKERKLKFNQIRVT